MPLSFAPTPWLLAVHLQPIHEVDLDLSRHTQKFRVETHSADVVKHILQLLRVLIKLSTLGSSQVTPTFH